ncbi:MAG: D-alanyl-D-alanine carboxypeptidase, partial [Clostridia bacterium]|nr:D-alanyl-D-alanine carboxypeptidase [Clostridia bacterium]
MPEGVAAATAAPKTSAASYALLDPIGGELIAAKDADTRRPMASTTKIMTALIVLERCDLEATVTVDQRAVGVE